MGGILVIVLLSLLLLKCFTETCHTLTGPSGLYEVEIAGETTTVWCDQHTDGGGWTSVIRRKDGSLDFQKSYEIYSIQGIGNPENDTEWALALSKLSWLTQQTSTELLVELEYGGTKEVALYEKFEIGSQLEGFRMSVSGYREESTAGDALASSNGMRFSAYNKDYDSSMQVNCAERHGPGWYRTCHAASPFGYYGSYQFLNGINWNTWLGYYISLTSLEFKIRPARCIHSATSACAECRDPEHSPCIDVTSGRKTCSSSISCSLCPEDTYLDPKTGECIAQCDTENGRFIKGRVCDYCHSACLTQNKGPGKCVDQRADSCLFKTCAQFTFYAPEYRNTTFLLSTEVEQSRELVMCEPEGWMSFIRNNDGLNAWRLSISDLEEGIHNFPHNVFMSLKYLSSLSLSVPLDLKVILKKADLSVSQDSYTHARLSQDYSFSFSHKVNSTPDLADFNLDQQLQNATLLARSTDMNSYTCADKLRAPSWYTESCGGFLALGKINSLFYGPVDSLKSIYFSVKESSCLKWDKGYSPPECAECASGYLLSADKQCIQCDAMRVCEKATECLNPQAFLEQNEDGQFICRLDRNCELALFPEAECETESEVILIPNQEETEQEQPIFFPELSEPPVHESPTLEMMGSAIKASTMVTVSGGVAASAGFDIQVENIWALVNTMQLIELFSLINLKSVPPNYRAFLNYLDFAHGDLSFLAYLPNILRFMLPLNYSALEENQKPFTPSFETSGIESLSLYLNYESRFLGFIYYSLFTLFLFLVGLTLKKFQKLGNFIKRFYISALFWRVAVEVYVELTLLTALSFYGFSFSDSASTFDFCLSVFFVLCILAFPITLTLLIARRIDDLPKEKKKWNGNFFTKNLQESSKRSKLVMLYYPLFLYERLFFALTLLLFNESPTLQLSLILLQFLLMLLYFIIIQPFEERVANYMQTFNHATMALQVCFFIIFSQQDSQRLQFSEGTISTLGSIMVSLLILNFVGNFLVMLVISLIGFLSKCKKKQSTKVVSTRSVETTEEKIRFKYFKRFSRFHLSERPLYPDKPKKP